MKTPCSALILVLLISAAPLAAHERIFSYTEESETLPQGALEFEQWITNRNGKAQGVYSAFDLRSELEYGITSRLNTAFYLNMKSEYSAVAGVSADVITEEFHFEGFSSEWKYSFLSPLEHAVGLLGYLEIGYNGPELEQELKLVAQSNFGEDWELAINATVEHEYLFEASRQVLTPKLELDGGLSYRIRPGLNLGLELRNHRIWADQWSAEAASAWFAGPVLHAAGQKAWVTLTVLPQLTGFPEALKGDGRDFSEHERIETRLLVGMNF